MTRETQELLDRALKLPPDARADLAARILESLGASDDPAEVASAWRDEILSRLRRVVENEEPGIPYEEVAAEIREHLARKRRAAP
jgi:putative addiction module component (TIGR02574 family)